MFGVMFGIMFGVMLDVMFWHEVVGHIFKTVVVFKPSSTEMSWCEVDKVVQVDLGKKCN